MNLQASPPATQPNPETAIGALQTMVDNFLTRLPYIAVAVLVFVVLYLVAKGVRALVRRVSGQRRRHRNLGLALGRLAQFAIVIMGLLIALVIAVPGFTSGRLIELLGLSSVAIGFAFRDVLQNFLAGILILVTEPFRIGDQSVFGSYEGTVEDIQTRADLNHFFGPLKMRGSVTSDTYLEPGSVFDTQDYYGDGAHYTAAATAQ